MKKIYTGYCALCERKILHKKKAVYHTLTAVFSSGYYKETIPNVGDFEGWFCEKCHEKAQKFMNRRKEKAKSWHDIIGVKNE